MRDEPSKSRSRDHDDPTERRTGLKGEDSRETFHVSVRDESDPCVAIVRSVAAITGTDPVALPPLVHTVDPEALRDLVVGDTDPAAGLCVTFTYADCSVSISADGELTLREPGSAV